MKEAKKFTFKKIGLLILSTYSGIIFAEPVHLGGIVAEGPSSSAFGPSGIARGDSAIAIGNSVAANGDASISMGTSSTAEAWNSMVFGTETKATANEAIALGSWARAQSARSVALGSHSITRNNYDNTVAKYTNVQNTDKTNGVISVGNGIENLYKFYRRITNVAGGVNANDAANIGQLDVVNQKVEDNIKTTTNNANSIISNTQKIGNNTTAIAHNTISPVSHNY